MDHVETGKVDEAAAEAEPAGNLELVTVRAFHRIAAGVDGQDARGNREGVPPDEVRLRRGRARPVFLRIAVRIEVALPRLDAGLRVDVARKRLAVGRGERLGRAEDLRDLEGIDVDVERVRDHRRTLGRRDGAEGLVVDGPLLD